MVVRVWLQAAFLELLQERAEGLVPYQRQTLTQDDLKMLRESLRSEARYQALHCLQQDRHQILLTHLGFIQTPLCDNCPYKDHCVDKEAHSVLVRRARR